LETNSTINGIHFSEEHEEIDEIDKNIEDEEAKEDYRVIS
jgi:hypothetical protein